METAISTLSVLPNNKEQIKTFSALLLNELDNGNAKPLEVLKAFKAFEKVFDLIKPELTKKCLNEATKYGERKFDACGISFETKEAGARYDFSGCNDQDYNILKEQIDRLTESLKKREEFLKAIPDHFDTVDKDTGEVITIYPPVKKSTTTLQTNF